MDIDFEAMRRESEAAIDMTHINDVPWNKAPIPPRRHKCWAQTKAFIDFEHVSRCACGAISMRRPYEREDYWTQRNTAGGGTATRPQQARSKGTASDAKFFFAYMWPVFFLCALMAIAGQRVPSADSTRVAWFVTFSLIAASNLAGGIWGLLYLRRESGSR